jgi:hypothetical protein
VVGRSSYLTGVVYTLPLLQAWLGCFKAPMQRGMHYRRRSPRHRFFHPHRQALLHHQLYWRQLQQGRQAQV